MRLLLPVLLFTAVSHPVAAARLTLGDYISEVGRLAAKEDYIGVRVVTRKMMRLKLTPGAWSRVRAVLHENPAAGWDLLRDWEKVSPLRESLTETDQLLAEGVELMRKQKFNSAFDNFQYAARQIRKTLKPGRNANRELYSHTLHMMGRALFGAGRLEEAYKVYSWIPATYSDFRRVTFERMWTAFRAKKIAEAVGALASQHSAYIGPFLEPEAYLVQIYIYRKLCRVEDLKLVMGSVNRFRGALRSEKFELYDWLRSDLSTRPYVRLLEQKESPASDLVSDVERAGERERLSTYLANRFSRERARLLSELDRVVAFSNMSFSASSKELPRIVKLPPPKVLLKSGLEMWPVDDAEDWLDELGRHIFTGDTQCASRSR